MRYRLFVCLSALTISTLVWAPASAQDRDAIQALKNEIQQLRQQMEAQQKGYEARLSQMQKELDGVSKGQGEEGAKAQLEAEAAKTQPRAEPVEPGAWERMKKAAKGLDLDLSVVIDTNYHNSDTPNGMDEIKERMAGFGHAHGEEEHEHGGFDEGFNLREVELYLSGAVDPYFKGYVTVGISEESTELEEAVIQTTSLPAGFQVLGGRFLSHFDRINRQHPHEWDFVDRPLIHELTFGDHGLLEKGAQVSWLAPTPFHMLLGLEALQGDNERLFNHIGGTEVPDKDGPRLGVGWLKISPNLPSDHGFQLGLFGARGIHQEAHDEDEDGATDLWLDGYGKFYGAEFLYRYDARREGGFGNLVLQGEYFRRDKDLSVYSDLLSDLAGLDRKDKQDGYYVQGIYGFLPRWRGGLRWEQVGLLNKSFLPDGTSEEFDDSHRLTGMLDFKPTEFSLLRLQASRGEYALEGNQREDVWQFLFQVMVLFGKHAAHTW